MDPLTESVAPEAKLPLSSSAWRPWNRGLMQVVQGSHLNRLFFVWVHRWTGLVMAGFLVFEGLTGSLLAFNIELERLISSQLFAAHRPGSVPLDLATLAERARRWFPRRGSTRSP